jgi:hypothetical protein
MSRDNNAASTSNVCHVGLKEWLRQQHFYFEKGKPYGATHVVTTPLGGGGGKLVIADDQHEAFLFQLANDLQNTCYQCSWTIHENATRYSRVYFDVKWAVRDGEPMNPAFLMQFVRALQKQVIAHFPDVVASKRRGIEDERGLCVVLAPPPVSSLVDARAPSEAQWRHNSSFHIVFPYLYADANQMLQLRAAVVGALDRKRHLFLPPGGAYSWDVAVEADVYTTDNAGLCMPGRSTVCDACAVKKTDRHASDTSGVVAGGAYAPLLTLNTHGEPTVEVESLRNDRWAMLRLCTIRMPYQYTNDPAFVPPTNEATTFDDNPIVYSVSDSYIQANLPRSDKNDRAVNPGTSLSLAARESRGYKRSAASLSVNARTGLKRGEAMSKGARQDFSAARMLEEFGAEHYFAEVFQKFLRNCTCSEYKRICVTNVRRCTLKRPRGLKPSEHATIESQMREAQAIQNMAVINDVLPCYYLITVAGDGSRYCLNIDDEHPNAKVYFYANYEGMQQRCTLENPTTTTTTTTTEQQRCTCNAQTTGAQTTALSGAQQRCTCNALSVDRVFCSAFTNPTVKWTDSAQGLWVQETFFGAMRRRYDRAAASYHQRAFQPLSAALRLSVASPLSAASLGTFETEKQPDERPLDKERPAARQFDRPPTAEELARICRGYNRAGVFDPPLNSSGGGGARVPAAEPALALALRAASEQRLRAARLVRNLPKRDELAPELRRRLAPLDDADADSADRADAGDNGSVRSTQPSNASQSHSSTTAARALSPVSYFKRARLSSSLEDDDD